MNQQHAVKKLLESLNKEIDLSLYENQIITRYLEAGYVVGWENGRRKQKGGLERKKVKGLDRKGKSIGTFDSIREAIRFIGGGDPGKICKCLQGKRQTYKGYTWLHVNN